MHVNCRLLSRFLTLAQIKLIFQEGNHAFYISEQIVIVHADTFWHHIKHDVPSKRKQNKKLTFPQSDSLKKWVDYLINNYDY